MTQLQVPDDRATGRALSQLDEGDRYQLFDNLQLTMPTVWESMQLGLDD